MFNILLSRKKLFYSTLLKTISKSKFDMSKNVRFDSWKEISNYLNKSTRTCQLLENKLGLPIYRINNNSKRSKVFAFKSEIDQWLLCKGQTNKKIYIINIFSISFFKISC